jgi:hypothetical protein
MRLILSVPLLAFAFLASPSAYAADCTNPDADGDGHAAIACGGDDCDDGDAGRFPGNIDVCDSAGVDGDCDYSTPGQVDRDGDGFNSDTCFNVDDSGTIRSQGDDCDDGQPSVHRIAVEVCNGIDDNCDGAVDYGVTREYWVDDDGDGFGDKSLGQRCPADSEGLAERPGDCDDGTASIFPGMQVCSGTGGVEICEADGTWTAMACAAGETCAVQPNELGVCYTAPKMKKLKGDDEDGSDD